MRIARSPAKLLGPELALLELRRAKEALEFSIDAALVGEWDLDLVNDTSRRSLRHDRCFGYEQPVRDWGAAKFALHIHADDRERVPASMTAAIATLKDWSADASSGRTAAGIGSTRRVASIQQENARRRACWVS